MDLDWLGAAILVILVFSIFPYFGYRASIVIGDLMEKELDKDPNGTAYNGAVYVKEKKDE